MISFYIEHTGEDKYKYLVLNDTGLDWSCQEPFRFRNDISRTIIFNLTRARFLIKNINNLYGYVNSSRLKIRFL